LDKNAYLLEFKNNGGYYSSCSLCSQFSCKGCVVPYSSNITVAECLNKYDLDRNDTLFSGSSSKRGKEFQVSITWHSSVVSELGNFLMMAKEKQKPGTDDAEMEDSKGSSEVQLSDCFQEFKQTETLDEDNKWYCNKCAEFVQA